MGKMRRIVLIAFASIVFSTANVESFSPIRIRGITYPKARRNESVIDDLHGTKVADPYRWLEDPFSKETKQFIDDENEISRTFLENNDKWKKINEKMTKIWNYPKFGVPQRKGNYYFSSKNTGLQNQNVLYKQKSLTDEAAVFLDPNTLSDDGTISLQDKSFSEDGSVLAYTLSESGSDWVKIKFRDVENGQDYPDLLERVKFTSLAWTHDNKGLFYNRYNQDGNGSETDSNKNQKLYYHRIGEAQENDVLVVEFLENPSWIISATVSSCGKYLIVIPESGHQLLYFADLEKNGRINGKITLTPVVTKFEAEYDYVTNIGSRAVLRTNKKAPNYRLVVIDFDNFEEQNWTTLIEENVNDVLTWARHVDTDKLVVEYLHDVKSVLQVYSLKSGELIRGFPLEIGQIVAFSGDKENSEIFYQLESFLTPGIIYRYDFSTPKTEPTVLHEIKLNLDGFNKTDFEVKQVFYPSRDGTKIPMFTVQRKTEAKKPRPCLLHAYGGFNIAIQPSFKVPFLFFVYEFNGILAVANIRGGGEYGEKWHDAGRLFNKQNVFDDFQTAAEYLVKEKYTVPKKIGIYGRSNGGLLMGACINQRPDLFGAAVPQVGVMDMLRFHKFTIGSAWIPDYGNPDEKAHFENIYKYSPLHNVRSPNSTENQYPPTLILTGDHDDRVSPLHSLKLAATLQFAVRDNQFQNNPLLLRVYRKTGHGDGKPTAKKIEEETDIYTFLHQALQIDTTV